MDANFGKQVGVAFLGGYQAGFIAGAVVGLSQNINEMPMIQLNQTLNTATTYGEHVGYTAAMGVTLFKGTKMLMKRVELNPIAESAIAGGVTGAVLGSKGGWKKAVGGGALGACVGATIGVAMEKNLFSKK